ncbi:isoprenylcysteine carboxylmethyltransferase family protein [Streptacidiphilus sp. P02-A3a]|nr:isoprenylcysteine carboxylmethyltransferase family protein [Streptacidiphilus sp. P02-A3a]
MQVRRYRMGGRAVRTEWGSLGVVAGAVAVGQGLAVLAETAVPGAGLGGGTPLLGVSLLVLWAGIALRLWAIRVLGRFFRGVVHIQENHRVVTAGPYRVLRHPAYSGALVAVLGLALASDNLIALVALFGCTLAGVLYRIRVEEQVLTSALGEAYTGYAAGTSRLLPGVW